MALQCFSSGDARLGLSWLRNCISSIRELLEKDVANVASVHYAVRHMYVALRSIYGGAVDEVVRILQHVLSTTPNSPKEHVVEALREIEDKLHELECRLAEALA